MVAFKIFIKITDSKKITILAVLPPCLNIFTKMFNHHYLIPQHLHHTEKDSTFICSHPPLPLLPLSWHS